MTEAMVKSKDVLELAEGLMDQAETALAATQQLAEAASAANAALAQGDFFDDGTYGVEMATLPDSHQTKHGKYTGAELERRILVRDAVVKWLAQGVGVRRIAATLRAQSIPCSERSILAFRDRRADLVATEKKQLSQQLGRIIKLAADSIEDRLASGNMKPSSVDLAVFIDKKATVDGEAALIVEHKHSFEGSADAFVKKLEEMKRAKVQQVITLAGAQDCQAPESGGKPRENE